MRSHIYFRLHRKRFLLVQIFIEETKINEVFRCKLLMRVTTSESLYRLTRIHSALHEPHILWSRSKAFPRYKREVLLAVRFIGILFTGKWYSSCQKCGKKSNAIAEHILLFCPSTNTFRFTLWRKLLTRFELNSFDNVEVCYYLIKYMPYSQDSMVYTEPKS